MVLRTWTAVPDIFDLIHFFGSETASGALLRFEASTPVVLPCPSGEPLYVAFKLYCIITRTEHVCLLMRRRQYTEHGEIYCPQPCACTIGRHGPVVNTSRHATHPAQHSSPVPKLDAGARVWHQNKIIHENHSPPLAVVLEEMSFQTASYGERFFVGQIFLWCDFGGPELAEFRMERIAVGGKLAACVKCKSCSSICCSSQAESLRFSAL